MIVLGLNSGTSVDSIDVAVGRFTAAGGVVTLQPLGFLGHPWPASTRREILDALPPGRSGAADWCRLDTLIGQELARAALAGAAAFAPDGRVDLVGSHGQTLYHWVEDGRVRGTLQAGQPAWIAEAVGCPVVADLRSADVVAGGQGAPLMALLDGLWLGSDSSQSHPTVVLNIGGIANVTVLAGPEAPARAWDTGPGNCLIDAAAQHRVGLPCDLDGRLAAVGRVDAGLLSRLLADPYYRELPPKSTGREHFTADYVDGLLSAQIDTADLIATLTELTARTIADSIASAGVPARVVVSGGGAHNPALMGRLAALIPAPVVGSDALGLPVDGKEAYLFALLAYLSVHGCAGTVPSRAGAATGARHPSVLGSLTPPTPLNLPAMAQPRALRVVQEGHP